MNLKKFTVLLTVVMILSVLPLSGCKGNTKKEEVKSMANFESVSIKNYGAAVDGKTNVVDAVVKAANAVGDNQAIYFPDGIYSFQSSIEINRPIRFSGNVTFVVNKGVTLVISSLMEAAEQKIFTGQGKVSITNENVWGYPIWFDDGTGNTQSNIQKAVDSLRCLYIPDGTYSLSDIVISNPTSIKGIGAMKIAITALSNTGKLFHIKSSDVSIENFKIDMKKASKDANCFYFDTGLKSLSNIKINEVDVGYGYTSIKDAESTANSLSNVQLNAIALSNVKATALIMKNFKTDIKLVDVSIFRRASLGDIVNVPGAVIENTEGMTLEHFDVNGDVETKETQGHGVEFKNCKNVTMRRVLMEYLGGTGYKIENCSDFYFENVQVYTFYNVGFDITNLKNSTFNATKVTYTLGDDISVKADNILLKSCENVTLNSVITSGARGAGLSMQGCKDVTINSLISCYRTGSSILDKGSNTNVKIFGFTDDKSGNSIKLLDNGITIFDAIIGGNEPLAKISGQGNY